MEGYIKLYRETMFSEIWAKPAEWYKIWNWILLNARYENGNDNIPKGCVLTNYDYISQQTFIKKRVVENCMRWLKESDMVVVHKRSRLVLIELKNWGTYQTTSGTQTEQERSRNGAGSGTIIKERRKKKEERSVDSKTTPQKIKYGEFGNVLLTEIEYSNLLQRFDKKNLLDLITKMDLYIGQKGANYKSHYLAIINWAKRDNITSYNKKLEDMNYEEMLEYALTFPTSSKFYMKAKEVVSKLSEEQKQYVRDIDKIMMRRDREGEDFIL